MPVDFLGVNYYAPNVVERAPSGGRREVRRQDAACRDLGWEIAPQSLSRLFVRLRDHYAPKSIAVTENGAAFTDVRGHDGAVRDPERRAHLEAHVQTVDRALAAGVPVSGCFVWSLLDNSGGRTATPNASASSTSTTRLSMRVPKASFSWYRDPDRGESADAWPEARTACPITIATSGRGRRQPTIASIEADQRAI